MIIRLTRLNSYGEFDSKGELDSKEAGAGARTGRHADGIHHKYRYFIDLSTELAYTWR
jgi:hypothetical protein